jgi:hypothetical protein
MKTGITFDAVDTLLRCVGETPQTYVGADLTHTPAFLAGMRSMLAMEGYRVSPQIYQQACLEHGIDLDVWPRPGIGPTLINRLSMLRAFFAADDHDQTIVLKLIAIERTALTYAFQAVTHGE